MSVKMCNKLTWCSKSVIFSTKLKQFVQNFYRVWPRYKVTLSQLDTTICAIVMMLETLKLSQIENFANFLGLNAIISKLVVGNIPVV